MQRKHDIFFLFAFVLFLIVFPIALWYGAIVYMVYWLAVSFSCCIFLLVNMGVDDDKE